MKQPDANGRSEAPVIAVVSLAHAYSHFSHLMVAPLFPWLKEAFALSYAELGLLMTVFFVVSGVAQALSGFVVDRLGAMPVLLGAIGLFVLAACGFAAAPSYPVMLAAAALAGLGNAPFHPIDYSILNARVRPQRLGMAYAVHGIAGNIGWALAPMLLVGVAAFAGWRWAFVAAAALAALVWAVVWRYRRLLDVSIRPPGATGVRPQIAPERTFAFLRLPAVWMSFLFFVTYAVALGGVQSFGAEAAGALHTVPREMIALCLTAYMVASAGGMIIGGLLVRTPTRADQMIGLGFGGAMIVALVIALSDLAALWVPALFALMGLGAGIAGPSRDLLVKAATPAGATGRVYGMVYSGLDIGMSCAPALFGLMMDAGQPMLVWIGIAVFQGLMILSVVKLGRTVRKPATRLADATA
jgi:FSR family fosmidomycin resistance protein-like MFS transporter